MACVHVCSQVMENLISNLLSLFPSMNYDHVSVCLNSLILPTIKVYRTSNSEHRRKDLYIDLLKLLLNHWILERKFHSYIHEMWNGSSRCVSRGCVYGKTVQTEWTEDFMLLCGNSVVWCFLSLFAVNNQLNHVVLVNLVVHVHF